MKTITYNSLSILFLCYNLFITWS